MFEIRRLTTMIAFVLAASASTARQMFAQQLPKLGLGIVAGPVIYDLSGNGTGFGAGIRVPWQAQTWLIVEPGVGFLSYNNQFDVHTSYLFPELSLQGQLRFGRVRPFLGGGVGGAFVLQGSGETVAALHGVLGTRIDMSSDWVVSGELRVRSVDPWAGNTADILFGVTRRLR
jgi:hypothetical protein